MHNEDTGDNLVLFQVLTMAKTASPLRNHSKSVNKHTCKTYVHDNSALNSAHQNSYHMRVVTPASLYEEKRSLSTPKHTHTHQHVHTHSCSIKST